MLQLHSDIPSRPMGEERGQTLAEYSVILVLISIVAVAVMQTVGVDIMGLFASIGRR